MLSVGDGIPDDVLQEDLQDSSCLLIDKARDTLDASSTSQSADGGLGDALDVVSEYLPVSLGASLSCMKGRVVGSLKRRNGSQNG